jgi:hypothetical protein
MGNEGSDRRFESDRSHCDDPGGVPLPTTTGLLGSSGTTIFSVLMGIIAPIVCLALQPVLLPGDRFVLPGLGFINAHRLFGYGVIGLEILALSAWLACGDRLGVWCGPLSGVLFAGALFAGGLGLVLLPFSLIGLLAIIGVLGFVPLFTARVFYRNGVLGYRHAGKYLGSTRLRASALLGAILVVGVPGAIQVGVSLVVRSAIRGVVEGEPSAMNRLRAWSAFVDRDRLVRAYEAEQDPVRKERLARAYKELTSDDVESRLSILND